MTVSPDDSDYRPCVGIMLFNAKGQVFVGRRIQADASKGWQMPQGGIDPGELPHKAALRELEEEVGTHKVRILQESTDWLHYDLPKELHGKVWKGKFKGQSQKWFAMLFLGEDSDFDLDHHHKPEFDAFEWIDIDRLPERIIEFKRPLYEKLVEEFSSLALSLAQENAAHAKENEA